MCSNARDRKGCSRTSGTQCAQILGVKKVNLRLKLNFYTEDSDVFYFSEVEKRFCLQELMN